MTDQPTQLPAHWSPALTDAFWTAVNAPTYEESAAATLAFAQLLAVVPVLSPPPDQTADRAAVLLDAAAECNKAGGAYAERGADAAAGAAFALMETFLRQAGEAEYAATPCTVPNVCEDGGDPCDAHERILGHIEGYHDLCAPDCGQEWQRRLAAEAPQPETPPADRAAVYREIADRLTTDAHGMQPDWARIYKRDAANKVREWADRLDGEGQQDDTTPRPVQHAPGKAVLCPDCLAKGHAICMDGEQHPVHKGGNADDCPA